jgi:hypothetical protein
MKGNEPACLGVLGELRRTGRADEADRRARCIEEADGCVAAASCREPASRTGWTSYSPQRGAVSSGP